MSYLSRLVRVVSPKNEAEMPHYEYEAVEGDMQKDGMFGEKYYKR